MHFGVSSDFIAYYLVTLLAFVECLVVGVVVFWRNRHQPTGVIWGLASFGLGVWCLGFSQYFRALPTDTALLWAKVTLTAAIINNSIYFHGMTELIGVSGRYRRLIIASYAMASVLVGLAWFGTLVTGLRDWTYLDHYIRYDRSLYPVLALHISVWPLWAVVLQIQALRRLKGFKRNQIIYFLMATVIILVSTTLIIVPIEYEISVRPFVFFVLPFNMAFLAYVLAKGRLMEINLAIGRALVYASTLFIVLLISLVMVGVVNQIDPRFLGSSQTLFLVALVVMISAVLAFTLPRFGPYVEQMIQTRLFGERYRYQQAISELISKVATIPSAQEMLQLIADQLVELVKVPHALVLMQEDTTTDFVVRARASLQGSNGTSAFLAENTEVIQWLRRNKRSLVKEEAQLREPRSRLDKLEAELEQLGASLCVPMIVDNQLVGTLALENKLSGGMFVEQDIRLLESLCAEVALAVRYRKFEQQMLQTSKLTSLGTLAAGIAHEIRNPLSSIKTFVQLLPTRLNDVEFQAEFTHLVSNDVDRITKLVENVLSFARSTSINITEQRIEDVIEDSLSLIKAKLKHKKVEVTKQYGQLPPARVDKDQLSQVLVNILLNAFEALPDQGGNIRITCSTSMLESPRSGRRGKTPHLTIEIADNGPGIPENIKGRLFDPFFTTKPAGTGLGLAITYKVVEVHGGFISINSTEGHGAAFLVHLPL